MATNTESGHIMFYTECQYTFNFRSYDGVTGADRILIATLGYGCSTEHFDDPNFRRDVHVLREKNFVTNTPPVYHRYCRRGQPIDDDDKLPPLTVSVINEYTKSSPFIVCQTTSSDGTIANGATAKAIKWLREEWKEKWQKEYDNLVILIPYGGQYMEDEMREIYGATDEGIIIVCAAGGQGGGVVFPAALGTVISVGVAGSGPRGREVDVCMEFQDINDGIQYSGIAAARVTGLLSLLLARLHFVVNNPPDPLRKIAESIKCEEKSSYSHTCVIRELLVNEGTGSHDPQRGYGNGEEIFCGLIQGHDDLLRKMADILLKRHAGSMYTGMVKSKASITPITDQTRKVYFHNLDGSGISVAVIDKEMRLIPWMLDVILRLLAYILRVPFILLGVLFLLMLSLLGISLIVFIPVLLVFLIAFVIIVLNELGVPVVNVLGELLLHELHVRVSEIILSQNTSPKLSSVLGMLFLVMVFIVFLMLLILFVLLASISKVRSLFIKHGNICSSFINIIAPKVATILIRGGISSVKICPEYVSIISCSMGTDQFDLAASRAVSKAVMAGKIFVFAAGNEGERSRNAIMYPARIGNVLVIGGQDPYNSHLSFSSVGRELDFLAPAVLGSHEGTSYAAPVIAGYIALLLQFIKEMPEDDYRITAWCENPAGTGKYEWREISIWKAAHNVYAMRDLLKLFVPKPQEHSEKSGFGCINFSVMFPLYRNVPKDFIVQQARKQIHERLQTFYCRQIENIVIN